MRRPFAVTAAALFIVLAWCASALALNPDLDISQYAHTVWRVRDGFAQAAIRSIAQTPDGYLWLGTESGLLRFDGVRAIPWQPQSGDQLPSNLFVRLLVAHDGTLWIGTLKGLASWKNGKLTQYREVAGEMIGPFFEDRDRTLWFAAYEPPNAKLCAFRDGTIKCLGTGTFGSFVKPLYQDHKGNIWLASQTGLWRWASGHSQQYPFSRSLADISAVIEDDVGGLLLATNDGLKQLAVGKIENYELPGITNRFTPTMLLRSLDGSLWVGTTSGLLHLNHGRVDRFSSADGLSGDLVLRIFEDREGDIWVATEDGLDRFREYSVPIISRRQGLSNSTTWAVQAAPDGSIWIVTPDAVDCWANRHTTVYRSRSPLARSGQPKENESNLGTSATEIVNSGLIGNPAALGLDDTGRLWASTTQGMFYLERGTFVPVPGGLGKNTFSVTGDEQGGVWILQNKNLFHWFLNGTIQKIQWSQFGQKMGRAMLPDHNPGGLWLGFYEGGLTYLKDGHVVRSYGTDDELAEGRVDHLRLGPNGEVWVSTESGLSRVKDRHVATLTHKNGLPCDVVHWSMEDDDHNVWLYMSCALVRIGRSEMDAWINNSQYSVKTTVFDNADGVIRVGIYGAIGPHVTKSPDGRIWFTSKNGVSVIDPHHLPINKLPPPVHIEKITADGKIYDVSNGLPLPARVRDVTIDYTALSLVAPEKIHFRYKLEGQDPDWREVVNNRQVQYSNLEPRSYRFRVMACNNSGVWNETGASIDFSIAPAYYQTTWFRALCVAAFAGLLWVLYQLRLRHIRRQFAVGMEERVGERLRIARELHDTLLQSFQGAVFQFQAARRLQLRKADNAMQVMDEAVVTAEQAINEGRAAIRDLRPEPVAQRTLPELLNAAGRELSGTHELDGNSPNFRVIVEGKQQTLTPILQDELYRISREVVRNAFKHASATHIEVEIRYDEDQLRLRIRDDGKGIDPKILEAGGQAGHFGIPGIRERAQRIGSRLEFWSEMGAGTEVELAVPAAMAYPKRRDGRRFRLFRRAGSDGQRS